MANELLYRAASAAQRLRASSIDNGICAALDAWAESGADEDLREVCELARLRPDPFSGMTRERALAALAELLDMRPEDIFADRPC